MTSLVWHDMMGFSYWGCCNGLLAGTPPKVGMQDFILRSGASGETINAIGFEGEGVDLHRQLFNCLGIFICYRKLRWALSRGTGPVCWLGPHEVQLHVGSLSFYCGPRMPGPSTEDWPTNWGVFISAGVFTRRATMGIKLIRLPGGPALDRPLLENSSCDLLSETGGDEGVLDVDAVVALVGPVSRSSISRVSPQPTTRDATPILTRAIARKVRLREGVDATFETPRAKALKAKIKKKGKLCGVRLADSEVNSSWCAVGAVGRCEGGSTCGFFGDSRLRVGFL